MADTRDLVAEAPSFFPHSSYNSNIERLSAPLLFLSKVQILVRVLCFLSASEFIYFNPVFTYVSNFDDCETSPN
jgi:hypothetical protein